MPLVAVELAPFVAIIIAIVITAWALATIVMLRPIVLFLANAAGDIPVIGNWLSDELRSLANYVSNWIQDAVNSAYQAGSRPFIDAMTAFGNTASGDAYSQRLLSTVMVDAIQQVAHNAIHVVNNPTQSYVTNSSTVNNTYVLANTDAAVTQSEAYTQSAYGQLSDWAYSSIISVYNDVVDADGRVAQLATKEGQDIATANGYAEAVAQSKADDAVTTANDYTQASFKVGEDYTTQVRDYATVINDKTRTWTDTLVTGKVDELNQILTPAITHATVIATAVTTAFADFMNNCGNPLCDNLGNFAKAFGETKDLLGLGLLLGFMVEAVTNPNGTAEATAAVADAITEPGKVLIHDIFGV